MRGLFEGGRVCYEEFSAGYYGVCAVGGWISAGTTHLAITPFDVLKVHMQVNPVKCNSISTCFTTLLREQGPPPVGGRGGKFFGYGIQGAYRFGLYEYFKKVIANVVLCPVGAVKVLVQAQLRFTKGLIDGFPKLYASEGFFGFYRGLVPLWGRNFPFNCTITQKEDCSTAQQIGVTCLAGYAAGSVGSIISNPADIVASLYNRKASSLKLAVKKIGLMNLFTRSLPIRIMFVGPVLTLQWLFYDTIKVLSGPPASGDDRTDVEEIRTT